MKMKKKSGATAAKKSAPPKKQAAKAAPAAKSAAKKPAPKRPSKAGEGTDRPLPYTPPPVEGIGWAPFRYPPQ